VTDKTEIKSKVNTANHLISRFSIEAEDFWILVHIWCTRHDIIY